MTSLRNLFAVFTLFIPGMAMAQSNPSENAETITIVQKVLDSNIAVGQILSSSSNIVNDKLKITCSCESLGMRSTVADLSASSDILSAQKICMEFNGRIYKDLGVRSRSGKVEYGILSGCSVHGTHE